MSKKALNNIKKDKFSFFLGFFCRKIKENLYKKLCVLYSFFYGIVYKKKYDEWKFGDNKMRNSNPQLWKILRLGRFTLSLSAILSCTKIQSNLKPNFSAKFSKINVFNSETKLKDFLLDVWIRKNNHSHEKLPPFKKNYMIAVFFKREIKKKNIFKRNRWNDMSGIRTHASQRDCDLNAAP